MQNRLYQFEILLVMGIVSKGDLNIIWTLFECSVHLYLPKLKKGLIFLLCEPNSSANCHSVSKPLGLHKIPFSISPKFWFPSYNQKENTMTWITRSSILLSSYSFRRKGKNCFDKWKAFTGLYRLLLVPELTGLMFLIEILPWAQSYLQGTIMPLAPWLMTSLNNGLEPPYTARDKTE